MIIRQSRRNRLMALEAHQSLQRKETIMHIRFDRPLQECVSADYSDLSRGFFRDIAEKLLLTADEQLDRHRKGLFPPLDIIVYTMNGEVPGADHVQDGAEWIKMCEHVDRSI